MTDYSIAENGENVCRIPVPVLLRDLKESLRDEFTAILKRNDELQWTLQGKKDFTEDDFDGGNIVVGLYLPTDKCFVDN